MKKAVIYARVSSTIERNRQNTERQVLDLKAYAELERDVVLVGVGNRIEIWSLERWEAMDPDKDMDDIAAAMESLGLSI